jgi:anaerobic selenocysteine-containing dehydrogenase
MIHKWLREGMSKSATTAYERNDIAMVGDYSNHGIAPIKQVVEKQFEAKDDYQIFSDLCIAYAGMDSLMPIQKMAKKSLIGWKSFITRLTMLLSKFLILTQA